MTLLRKANPVKIEHLKTYFNHLGTWTAHVQGTELMKKALKSLYDLYYLRPNYFVHEDIDNVTIRRMLDSAMNRSCPFNQNFTETHIDKMLNSKIENSVYYFVNDKVGPVFLLVEKFNQFNFHLYDIFYKKYNQTVAEDEFYLATTAREKLLISMRQCFNVAFTRGPNKTYWYYALIPFAMPTGVVGYNSDLITALSFGGLLETTTDFKHDFTNLVIRLIQEEKPTNIIELKEIFSRIMASLAYTWYEFASILYEDIKKKEGYQYNYSKTAFRFYGEPDNFYDFFRFYPFNPGDCFQRIVSGYDVSHLYENVTKTPLFNVFLYKKEDPETHERSEITRIFGSNHQKMFRNLFAKNYLQMLNYGKILPLNDRYIPYFIESIEGEYQPPKKLEK